MKNNMTLAVIATLSLALFLAPATEAKRKPKANTSQTSASFTGFYYIRKGVEAAETQPGVILITGPDINSEIVVRNTNGVESAVFYRDAERLVDLLCGE